MRTTSTTLAEHRYERAGLLPLLGLERFDRRAINQALAGHHREESGMKVTVQIVLAADDEPTEVREVFTLDAKP